MGPEGPQTGEGTGGGRRPQWGTGAEPGWGHLNCVLFSLSAHTDMLGIGNTLTGFTRSLAEK